MNFLNNLIDSLAVSLGDSLPKILVALLILIAGFFIAKLLRKAIQKMLQATGIDNKLGPDSKFTISDFLSKLAYWVILLYLFVFILNMMGVTGALEPLQQMITDIIGYLPNILAAGIIAYIGYMIASIVKEALGMIAPSITNLSSKAGWNTKFNLMDLLKQIVFIFIIVPFILIALDVLNITIISEPATLMLTMFFEAVPQIIAAAIILLVFVIVGKFIKEMVANILESFNVEEKLADIGAPNFFGTISFSKLASNILYFFILFFGVITASEILGFANLTAVLNDVLVLSGNILFGLLILAIGNQLSLLVQKYFSSSSSPTLGSITRFATLALFLAISLNYMGIADDIINLAFGLTLGAVAVAFALSFGLGGREEAGQRMKQFFEKLDKKKS